MASENSEDTLSVQIANQIINIANTRREDGLPVDDIAAGLRHAAANFSAFAYFQSENRDVKPDDMVEEFVNLFSHYLDLHQPETPAEPASGLDQLIAQAKNEI